MSPQNPKDFFKRYLQGNLSETDRIKFLQWYHELPEEEATLLFDQLSDSIDNLEPQELQILENKLRAAARSLQAENEINTIKKVKSFPIYLRVAASLFLVCAASFIIYYNFIKNQYGAVAYLEKQTQFGQMLEIKLADGSKVKLNAGTKFKYPENFKEASLREVFLDGEAFFEVTHDKTHPFVVRTPKGIQTRVLGTSFNINTYKKPNEVEVSVVTGKVAVSTAEKELSRLEKDQQLTYNTESKEFIQTETRNANDWTKGELIFNGETLNAVAAELERAYNINIEISPSIAEKLRCSGKFNLKQKPEEIIQVLCALHDLKYKSTNNIITISQ